MKIYPCVLAAAVMTACAAAQISGRETTELKVTRHDAPQDEKTRAFEEQLRTYLDTIKTLKPGHTRRDILKLFDNQGGLSTPTEESFQFKQCFMIKVDVVFEIVDPDDNSKDVIKTISAPYLGYMVLD